MICTTPVLLMLRFLGRSLDDAIHAHQQEASEKRQGTKSRRWSTELAAGCPALGGLAQTSVVIPSSIESSFTATYKLTAATSATASYRRGESREVHHAPHRTRGGVESVAPAGLAGKIAEPNLNVGGAPA